MKALFLKDLPYSAICCMPIIGGWLVYLFDSGGHDLRPQAAYMIGFFLIAGVSGALVNRELNEHTSKAYAFLRALPITDKEIVVAKFSLALFDTCLCWSIFLVTMFLFEGSPEQYAVHTAYVTLWAFLALMIAAAWQIGIYRFGMGKTAITLTVLLMFVLLPLSLLLDQAFEFENTLGFPPYVYVLAGMDWSMWLLATCLVLLLYWGLMLIALRIKKTSEVYL
jgi:hypothetical protein